MGRKANQKNDRGMTLVEMVVTMAIMGIVALAVSNTYISTQKSTSRSLEVTDVQANLRVAMNRMVQDIQMAGFLANGTPVSGFDPVSLNSNTLTINTASAGGNFARASAAVTAAGTSEVFNVASDDMTESFNDGDPVRIFRPALLAEPYPGTFTVSTTGTGTITLTGLALGQQFQVGDIILKVRSGYPANFNIVYLRTAGNALRRQMQDGGGTVLSDQVLATNISNLGFDVNLNSDGVANKVKVTLTGTTSAGTGGKIRTLESSATVRNL